MPELVYMDEFAPGILTDAKYAGCDNFIGRPIDGYEAPRILCVLPMAEMLVQIEERLKPEGLRLKVFDSFRPQRAVDDFVRWTKDDSDQKRKQIHYPNEEKRLMLRNGYIAARSGHSRGCAVDLTLCHMDGTELDMGTCFDFMDILSHHGAVGISEKASENRELLKRVMTEAGLKPLSTEWWHYRLDPEPYPDTYFDIPIQ